MPTNKTLLLVRHGATSSLPEKRYIGRTNPELDSKGRRQVASILNYIRIRKPERLLSSPLARARQTADIIANALGLEVELDHDLQEVDFGRWEGMTFEEILSSDPELVNRWTTSDREFAFPGGESLDGFFERTRGVANRVVMDCAETTVVVTHGGVIRSIICCLLGAPHTCQLSFEVNHASITAIDVSEGAGVLTGLHNPTSFKGTKYG